MATLIGLLVVGVVAGLALGVVLGTRVLASRRLKAAQSEQERRLVEAGRDADAIRREAQVEAREQALRLRGEIEQEMQGKRSEIIKIEERVTAKEEEIDHKLDELDRRQQGLQDREAHLKQLQDEAKHARDEQLVELERISGLTVEEAKRHVLERSEELVRHDLARTVRQLEEEARTDAKRRARNLVADALQRVAASHAAETTVSIVELPSDDMKGRIIGRLRYRTSYGQNILKHSLECAHLAGIMASELGASVKTAKRAALLHDVGKAMTHEVEGSHAAISGQQARRFGESQHVVHAIEAHHYEVQPQTVEAVLVIAADAVSASRPGARGESLENYIKRLESLEKIAAEKKGVERVYALQAGREIRVMVKPGEIDDDAAVLLSHTIAREIEEQLEYPGQIKVTVIRESRAIEFAK